MAKLPALKLGRPNQLYCQAIAGVLDLSDPYAIPINYLMRARNMYLPDAGSGSGVSQRPGIQCANPTSPIGLLASGRIGQALGVATIADGTEINFAVVGGRLFRIEPGGFDVYTDVTPSVDVVTSAPITIDPGARVYLTPFSNRLVICDDTNTPWVADDLLATPVTGQLIDYCGDASPIRTYGPAWVYQGTLGLLVRYRGPSGSPVSGVAKIGWSLPEDPFTGWEQTDYDYEWDVTENDPSTIYAVVPTNLQINYWRGSSIGYLSGSIGIDFETTATTDAIDEQAGARAPAGICMFGNTTFFVDADGGVNSFAQGADVQENWFQMRRVNTSAPRGFHDINARTTCAVIVPQLNLYLAAIWSEDPTQSLPQFPTTLYAFDARKGKYLGEWVIGLGVAVHAMGILVGNDGQRILGILGTSPAAPAPAPQPLGVGGFLHTLSQLEDSVWTDSGVVPDVFTTSPPLGYQPGIVLTVDMVEAIVEEVQTDDDPVEVEIVVG